MNINLILATYKMEDFFKKVLCKQEKVTTMILPLHIKVGQLSFPFQKLASKFLEKNSSLTLLIWNKRK